LNPVFFWLFLRRRNDIIKVAYIQKERSGNVGISFKEIGDIFNGKRIRYC